MPTYVKTFTAASGLRECHAIVMPDLSQPFTAQLIAMQAEIDALAVDGLQPIMVRWFLSDAANQAEAIGCLPRRCAVSIVEQPPLCGAKACAWVWLQEGVDVSIDADGDCRVKHRANFETLIRTNACISGETSHNATRQMLLDLAAKLPSLADNCLRTWLFVRDVDVNYAGVVNGRNEAFKAEGLSEHYLASTGINGAQADPKTLVSMDALCHIGINPANTRYLTAATHLNPTREYGVAFERATAIDLPDRRHVYVSGTASINNKGEIVHSGDVVAQAHRMIENVEALLSEAECNFADVGHLIVYLRDPADYAVVAALFAQQFPDIPTVIVRAPVCRPGWLIEMECMAFKSI